MSATATTPVPNVYACIAAVSAEIAKSGISKSRNNATQGYKFRGIDDVYNALAPLLAQHQLVIIPRILSREVVERQTKTGGTLNYVTVEAEFDFVSAKDGSKVTARSYGEAMDSADKGTNKAMSAAYKYTAFQTFCIPTEGDNDADATTPEHSVRATTPLPPASPQKPQGYDDWRSEYLACADTGRANLRKMFKESSPELREYLTKHDVPTYNKAVEAATAADANAAKGAA